MTYDTFFHKLSRLKRKWRYNDLSFGKEWGSIRSGQTCPIVAVAGYTGCDAYAIGAKIGLTHRQISRLVSAADALSHGPLRRRMLKVVGLA